jgi:hypothetical protein
MTVPTEHPVKGHPADHALGKKVQAAAQKVREAAQKTQTHKELKKATKNLHEETVKSTHQLSFRKIQHIMQGIEKKVKTARTQAEKTLLTNFNAFINSLKVYAKNMKININILKKHAHKVETEKKMKKPKKGIDFVGGDPRTWAPPRPSN